VASSRYAMSDEASMRAAHLAPAYRKRFGDFQPDHR
jgi:hypothetical protein